MDGDQRYTTRCREYVAVGHVGNSRLTPEDVLAKLQLRDRVQAVIYAYEAGLTGPLHP